MSFVHRIALTGATGQVGSQIARQLAASSRGFELSALARPESKTEFYPSQFKVRQGDWSDSSFLRTALQGQDALIISLAGTVPLDTQEMLIKAAVAENVKFVFLNRWGVGRDTSDLAKLSVIPVQPTLTAITRCEDPSSSTRWIGISNGFWTDYSLQAGLFGIDILDRTAELWDGGDQVFSTTPLWVVGSAVANLLSKPVAEIERDFSNREINIYSFVTSQKDLLKAAQEATSTTDKDWQITHRPSSDVISEYGQKLAKGDRSAFARLLYASYLQKGLDGTDASARSVNKQLGLSEGLEHDALVDICRRIEKKEVLAQNAAFIRSMVKSSETRA